MVGRRTYDQVVTSSTCGGFTSPNDCGQIVHTHVYVTKQYDIVSCTESGD